MFDLTCILKRFDNHQDDRVFFIAEPNNEQISVSVFKQGGVLIAPWHFGLVNYVLKIYESIFSRCVDLILASFSCKLDIYLEDVLIVLWHLVLV